MVKSTCFIYTEIELMLIGTQPAELCAIYLSSVIMQDLLMLCWNDCAIFMEVDIFEQQTDIKFCMEKICCWYLWNDLSVFCQTLLWLNMGFWVHSYFKAGWMSIYDNNHSRWPRKWQIMSEKFVNFSIGIITEQSICLST